METNKLQDIYTIVVVASIESPYYIQASWMRDRNIINSDEWLKVNNVIVVPDTSRFKIGENMNFYCDKNRIQIGTNDSTKVARLQSIAEGIIASIDISDDKFKAVGINNEYLFTFKSIEDSIHFGDYFVPLNKWDSFFRTPRVLDFTITDESEQQELSPKKTIKISGIGTQENTNIPIINANSNYHYKVKDRKEALIIISQASKTFQEFSEGFSSFINKIQ